MRKCLSCQTAIFRAVPCNEAIPQNTSAQPLFAISEAQILKSVQHPGIPTIYDFEEDESFYYLVEEYIQGDSLEEFLLHQQSISQNQFLYFCEQLCDILHICIHYGLLRFFIRILSRNIL